MKTAEHVMEAFRNGLLGTELIRRILEAESWCTPTRDGRPFLLDSPNGRWFNVFSSNAAMVGFCALNDLPTELFISIPGSSVFDMLKPGVAGINLDPEAGGFHYRSSQFDLLKSVVDARRIEAFLHGAEDVEHPFRLMRDFEDYYVLEDASGRWMLAPDNQNRALLAICTTPDTAVALQRTIAQQLKVKTTARRMDGRALFSEIRRRTDLNGVVFNPKGIVKPRAMAVAIADHVLNSDG